MNNIKNRHNIKTFICAQPKERRTETKQKTRDVLKDEVVRLKKLLMKTNEELDEERVRNCALQRQIIDEFQEVRGTAIIMFYDKLMGYFKYLLYI